VESLAVADDNSDADGTAVLDFAQAQTLARARRVDRVGGKTGPLHVSSAIDSYIEFLESNRRSGREARYAADAFILPALGKFEVASLTTDQIRKWHLDLAKKPARIRTKPGKKQRFRTGEDPDQARRRKSTANRILTILKAALNRAWRDGLTPSDSAWRRVEPFEGADAARVRFLTLSEATRLINASSPDFRLLVRGALETGARYGELCALTVADFDGKTIAVMQSKSGRPRRIALTTDGAKFFKSLTVGRPGTERLFKKADGSPWLSSHQAQPMKAACANAGITPAVNFHALRHAYASLCVMNGISLLIVAGNLGHSSTRMCEKFYAHLSQSHVTEAIEAGAPRFGLEKSNVTALER
jgi:integrase